MLQISSGVARGHRLTVALSNSIKSTDRSVHAVSSPNQTITSFDSRYIRFIRRNCWLLSLMSFRLMEIESIHHQALPNPACSKCRTRTNASTVSRIRSFPDPVSISYCVVSGMPSTVAAHCQEYDKEKYGGAGCPSGNVWMTADLLPLPRSNLTSRVCIVNVGHW